MLPFHWWQSNHHEFRRHHMVSHREQNTDVQCNVFPELICLNSALSAPVHCGTLRRVSRPRFSRATAAMSWVFPCRPTSAPLCREPVTPQSNCGTSGTACAGRPSQATSQTSTPSVWVSSGPCNQTISCQISIFWFIVFFLSGIIDSLIGTPSIFTHKVQLTYIGKPVKTAACFLLKLWRSFVLITLMISLGLDTMNVL